MSETDTEWTEIVRRRHQDELSELLAKADATSGRKSKRFLNELAEMMKKKKKKQKPEVAVVNASVNGNINKQSVAFVHMARKRTEREKRKVEEAEAKARQKEELKVRSCLYTSLFCICLTHIYRLYLLLIY